MSLTAERVQNPADPLHTHTHRKHTASVVCGSEERAGRQKKHGGCHEKQRNEGREGGRETL